MSLSRSTTFSTSSRTGSIRRLTPHSSAASVYAGAGGRGHASPSPAPPAPMAVAMGAAMGQATGLAMGQVMGNEKETMQDLNERLATYLEKVRSLENNNRRLEAQIRESLAKRGPSTRDWGNYWDTIQQLRDKVRGMRIVMGIGMPVPCRYEAELAIRTSVESDIAGLRKVLDDTNMARLQLEGEIEALREELIFMKKNHEEEVNALQGQAASAGLTVEVDAPQAQDLGQALAELRAQYDVLAKKNLEELEKQWGQQTTLEVTQSTKEVDTARSRLLELRRSVQSLEIDLDNAGLEGSLAETEARYGAQLEQLQGLILRGEEELAQARAELQRQNREYCALQDAKSKLEAEIATYRALLEGGEGFRWDMGDGTAVGLWASGWGEILTSVTLQGQIEGRVVAFSGVRPNLGMRRS
uniref:IF rod domain-containing protein n=1 Tax=Meleagris gallopavo TaxID=9103 RepID=A0A803Y534_MELGA